jgi:23S rRNA pseudouridine1911/1915/1917 synthase
VSGEITNAKRRSTSNDAKLAISRCELLADGFWKMNRAHREVHDIRIPVDTAGLRLDQALAQLLPQYSRSSLKEWIDAGQVLLNGVIVKPRTRVAAGDAAIVTANLAASLELEPQSVAFEFLYIDQHLLIIDKPAGLVVHPGAGNADGTLVNGLLARLPELGALPRAGLIHRIDKNTSGLLIAARTPSAYQVLVRRLAAREISREYLAIVNGVLVAGGTIEGAIARDPHQRTRMRVANVGRDAVTHYRVRARYRAQSALDVTLETGRTHQIRVHLAWRDHPLIGDRRYGSRPRPPPGASSELVKALESFPRQALHARRLMFTHPVSGDVLVFESPVPADLIALMASLEADQHHHQVQTK